MERPKTSRRIGRKTTNGVSMTHGGGDLTLPPSLSNSAVYRFTQFAIDTRIAQSGSGPSLGAISFKISDLGDITAYEALFDQYRIVKVDVTFRPWYRANSRDLSGSGDIIPLIYAAVDYDDSNITSINELKEYQNCVVHDDVSPFTLSFEPCVLQQLYASSITTGYSPVKGAWIDLANANVPHYGIKFGISNSLGTTFYQSWNVTTRYSVEFKNVR